MNPRNAWLTYSKADLEAVEALSARYRDFLDAGKTERECASIAYEAARAKGFEPLEVAVAAGRPPRPGDRLMTRCMDKALVLFLIGRQNIQEGMNLIGAHIDSPRLDVKQNPYEEEGRAAFGHPLLWRHQKVPVDVRAAGAARRRRKDRRPKLTISVGERDDEPVIGISDLLAHLSRDQLEKKGAKF